jgi:hypothetical protein
MNAPTNAPMNAGPAPHSRLKRNPGPAMTTIRFSKPRHNAPVEQSDSIHDHGAKPAESDTNGCNSVTYCSILPQFLQLCFCHWRSCILNLSWYCVHDRAQTTPTQQIWSSDGAPRLLIPTCGSQQSFPFSVPSPLSSCPSSAYSLALAAPSCRMPTF